MNELNTKDNSKIFYTIGEVAEMFDVNQSLIRFWEKNFDVLSPTKNKKGNRLFTPKDIEVFTKIYHLVKEKGMKLDSAARYLKLEGKGGIEKEVRVVEKLQEIRSLLEGVLGEIEFYENEKLNQAVVYNNKKEVE